VSTWWTQIRLVARPDGRFALVTAFLGLSLTRREAQVAGLPDIDPQDLDATEAVRVGNWLEGWMLKGRAAEAKARQAKGAI